MDTKHKTVLEKHENEIKIKITEISKVIQDLKRLLDTGDVLVVSKYQSNNEEFRKLPPKLNTFLPKIQPVKITREQLLKQFGSLLPLSIEIEEQEDTSPFSGTESSLPDRPLLDDPHIITELDTGYEYLEKVSCLSDEEIWTSGYDKTMKLYNLKGELIKLVQTKSGNAPKDIAVSSGHLVYTDYDDNSINLVNDAQSLSKLFGKKSNIEKLITLRGWRPRSVSSTSSDDLLIIMDSDEQTKVVRYCGSKEKQSYQYDNQDQPLFSPGGFKSLCENRNLNICVSDWYAHAVVVVSAAGKLRFRYTGPLSTPKESFSPLGITTDSHANILTADRFNDRIHIVDQDGRFLRFIDNCGLIRPWGLCVDSKDNLFVAEEKSGKLKKIEYYCR